MLQCFPLEKKEPTCLDGFLLQVADEGVAVLGADHVKQKVQVEEDTLSATKSTPFDTIS